MGSIRHKEGDELLMFMLRFYVRERQQLQFDDDSLSVSTDNKALVLKDQAK